MTLSAWHVTCSMQARTIKFCNTCSTSFATSLAVLASTKVKGANQPTSLPSWSTLLRTYSTHSSSTDTSSYLPAHTMRSRSALWQHFGGTDRSHGVAGLDARAAAVVMRTVSLTPRGLPHLTTVCPVLFWPPLKNGNNLWVDHAGVSTVFPAFLTVFRGILNSFRIWYDQATMII